MDNETDLIYPESTAPKSTAIGKIKTVLCKAFSYILIGIGIVSIGVIAVPTVILIIVIMGLRFFLDRILSILEQKKESADGS